MGVLNSPPVPKLDRRGLSGPALRTFFRIAERWGLSADEQMTLLGVMTRSTFFKWKKDADAILPRDTLSGSPTSSASTRRSRSCCLTRRPPTRG
jgi:hypothetical protein